MTTPVAERLSAANLAWLKEFSVVMHRRFAYPPKHPSLVAAEGVALRALGQALSTEKEIVMTVGRRQLTIGGASSDPRNPALGELAERMHRQGIAGIALREGLDGEEFGALLDFVVASRAPESDDDDVTAPRLGDHASVELLSYEGLALDDEDDEGGPDEKGEQLWRELADAALAGWDGVDGAEGGGGATDEPRISQPVRLSGEQPAVGAPTDAAEGAEGAEPAPPPRPSAMLRRTAQLPAALSAAHIAAMISARAKEGGDNAAILKSLLRVGRHARRRGRAGGGAVAARLREVLAQVAPGTLDSLLGSEVDPVRKRLLLMQGVDALPVSAVTDWIEAAAKSDGKSVSNHLLMLFKKLASQTRRRRDAGADDGGEPIREAARQLIEDWTFESGATEAHETLLAKIAAYDDAGAALDGGGAAGADRILQIALETNVSGADVLAAVNQLIEEKRLSLLFRYLDEAEGATIAGPMITEHLLEPETVRRVLLNEPIEVDGARLLLERCELPQADAILDALAISESEATRRLLLDRLRELGDAVRGKLIARLDGAAWYVQRNLLSLLAELREPPGDLPFDAYTKHEEAALRLEAYRLLARIPERREAAVHDALSDKDHRVIRAGLELAAGGVGRRTHQRLFQIVQQADDGSDIRIRGVPLLVHVTLPPVRDWLLALVRRRRGAFMFRRWVLAPKTPETLAALRVLAARWSADAEVKRVLALAAASDDPHVVAAGAGREAR